MDTLANISLPSTTIVKENNNMPYVNATLEDDEALLMILMLALMMSVLLPLLMITSPFILLDSPVLTIQPFKFKVNEIRGIPLANMCSNMMSKRDYEKKRREEQEATAHVFQDFINTFQDSSPAPNKTFVKSGILNSEDNRENKDVRQLYNPKPIIKQSNTNNIKTAIECARILRESNLEKSKKQEKPKSNLDLLKEELKLRHAERGERERLRSVYLIINYNENLSTPALSYFEGGDPKSTNLFVANLHSKITENHLMLEFGAYGPLASVKIMWPRGDEKLRNSNCGFVAFMSRKDAERALKNNKHREDMRVGWGKSVELPAHPIYIPNNLLKLYLPPPLSGLPFNAQPLNPNYKKPINESEFNDLLSNCVVKVTIPLNKKILMLVHRMVEFVVREGPMFEAFIMNREMGNPEFNFLFDYQNPVHAEAMLLTNLEIVENFEDDSSSTDEPLDGANLLKRSLKNEIGPDVVTSTSLGEKSISNKKQIMEYFIPSKWDTIDPQEVEAQAMSTQKMYYMELENQLNQALSDDEKHEVPVVKSADKGNNLSSSTGSSKSKSVKSKQKKGKEKEGKTTSVNKSRESRDSKKTQRYKRK
ncbi:hypothetical protein NQ314_010899 [Rhamnusium bicolor]|uniref:RRM domain-containing protein n=1 Tax=Rhamnusium bicolor TaxID=1586634 RepID=A0AAV8XNZ8_9CUCU|nr:hypothetical protein NQ314_010899 [Rhamnusium bicolor]